MAGSISKRGHDQQYAEVLQSVEFADDLWLAASDVTEAGSNLQTDGRQEAHLGSRVGASKRGSCFITRASIWSSGPSASSRRSRRQMSKSRSCSTFVQCHAFQLFSARKATITSFSNSQVTNLVKKINVSKIHFWSFFQFFCPNSTNLFESLKNWKINF